MSFLVPPILTKLQSLPGPFLISGCGGGFDLVTGIPLVIGLLDTGKQVILANYSFTYVRDLCKGEKITDCCYKVTADTSPYGYCACAVYILF